MMATVIYGRRGSPHLFPPPRTVGEDEGGGNFELRKIFADGEILKLVISLFTGFNAFREILT